MNLNDSGRQDGNLEPSFKSGGESEKSVEVKRVGSLLSH